MLHEIIPGIYRLELPLNTKGAPRYVNSYLIKGDEGYLMVDTGWNIPEIFETMQKELAGASIAFTDIQQILITHIHPDHYGLAGRLKELSGAKLILHHVEQKLVALRYISMDQLLEETAWWLYTNGVTDTEELEAMRNASIGIREYVVPCEPDIRLRGGQLLRFPPFNFEVVWTPGHSPGHICLYETEHKVFFSGDHIIPGITPNVGKHPQSGRNPLGNYISSLHDVSKMDIAITCPGHGLPFTGTKERIREIIGHHKKRSSELLDRLQKGPRTAFELAGMIEWGKHSKFSSLPPLHQRLATFETLSHLDYLLAKGKVYVELVDGIDNYVLDMGI